MYSSSNMLRARKKDASFKPNRVLDKKSSRGMLYENEELRLRTIHINDEVERGHSDIKKLKKENEHLKREIWSLRDEYEKMEVMLSKVIATQEDAAASDVGAQFDENGSYILMDADADADDGCPPDEFAGSTLMHVYPKYQKRVYSSRKCSGATTATGTTIGSGTSMYDSEDEEMNFMMMMEEDAKSLDSSTQIQRPSSSTAQYQIIETEVESHAPTTSTSSHASTSFDPDNVQPPPPQHYHHFWHHLTSSPPELEVVREESENNNSCSSPKPNSVHPSPNFIANEPFDLTSPSPSLSPSPNPIIEITPATTTSNSGLIPKVEPETEAKEQEPENANFQDLGCFTLIPQTFHASSQLKISPDGAIETEPADGDGDDDDDDDGVDEAAVATKKLTGSRKPCCHCDRRIRNRAQILRRSSCQSPTFPNSLNTSQPFPFFHASEPSLSLSLSSSCPRHSGFEGNKRPVSLNSSSRMSVHQQQQQQAQQPPNYNSCSLGWNSNSGSGERNVVIGYIENNYMATTTTGGSDHSLELRAGFGVKEIIDELESRFDPTLEAVTSVRLMTTASGCTRIFIILKSPGAARLLVEKGGLRLGRDKIPIRLIDGASECCTLILSGLPAEALVEPTLISYLSQFGQVVGPIERRLYKGIDISECQTQIHLVKSFPSLLRINGYEIQAKICQSQVAEAVVEPSTSVTGTGMARPPVVPLQRSSVTLTENNPPPHSKCTAWNLEQILPVHQPLSRTSNNNNNNNNHSLSQVDSSGSQIPPGCSSPRLLRQSSPSPSVQTTTSCQHTTPTPIPQVKGGHVVVRRSISSAPRLESNGLTPTPNPNPSSPQQQQLLVRRVSVCTDIEEEVDGHGMPHLSRPGTDVSVSGSNSSLLVKRPLAKLPKSSPGSLIPETQQQYVMVTGIPASPGLLSRKQFYRSMSGDPRRGSNSSRQVGDSLGRLSVGDVQEQANTADKPRSRSPQTHSSQLERVEKAKMSPATANDSQKTLPWCGCWGNGCL